MTMKTKTKQKDTARVFIRLKADAAEKVRSAAKRQGISCAELIRRATREMVEYVELDECDECNAYEP